MTGIHIAVPGLRLVRDIVTGRIANMTVQSPEILLVDLIGIVRKNGPPLTYAVEKVERANEGLIAKFQRIIVLIM